MQKFRDNMFSLVSVTTREIVQHANKLNEIYSMLFCTSKQFLKPPWKDDFFFVIYSNKIRGECFWNIYQICGCGKNTFFIVVKIKIFHQLMRRHFIKTSLDVQLNFILFDIVSRRYSEEENKSSWKELVDDL